MKYFVLLLLSTQLCLSQDYFGFISHWEGIRTNSYTCSQGFKTVGVGHRVVEGEKCENLTSEEVFALFEKDLAIAESHARKVILNFENRLTIVKLICVDLIYNLGPTGFNKFKKTIKACNDYDYVLMSEELKNSLWYLQAGRRSKHHVYKLGKLNYEK